MPFDSHMLLALSAPRPLYVASAEEDRWSDPRGEFLGAVGASRVYELLGKKGLGTDRCRPTTSRSCTRSVITSARASTTSPRTTGIST